MRLNKYISHAGICSRREADTLIEAGTIKVNGVPITKMGYQVKEDDVVLFNGSRIHPYKTRYLLLNKPKRYCAKSRSIGKKTSVFQLIKGKCKEKVFPIDKPSNNMCGLLIFTNDQQLSTKLSKSNRRIKKVYHLILNKKLISIDMKKIQDKIRIDGDDSLIKNISYVDKKDKTEIGIETISNKKNILNLIFEDLGYRVMTLDLVSYAGITKKNLPRGKSRFLAQEEVNILKRI